MATDFDPFISWLQQTIGVNATSARAYSTAVGRLQRACDPMTVESLTSLLYSFPTHKRTCARTAWRQWTAYQLEQGVVVPTPDYVGLGAAAAAKVPDASIAGLRASHARAREAKHARDNPAGGRIMITLTSGDTFVGDVAEAGGRIDLVRATMVQSDGTIAILPGKVSIPADKEAFRVCVANDAFLGRAEHGVKAR